MRIVVVEPSGTGGLVHFAYQLCGAIAAQGADVTLITSSHYELSACPHYHRVLQTMKLWPIVEQGEIGRPASAARRLWRGTRRGLRGLILMREWLRLTVFLARARPDIVQVGGVTVPAIWPFLAALRLRGIAVSQICHEYKERDEKGRPDRLTRFLMARTYAQMNAVFFLSRSVRDTLARSIDLPVDRTHLVPHGNQEIFSRLGMTADLAGRYGIRPDDFVVLLFGIIRPSKGAEDLLKAFAQLDPAPQVKLLIVGRPTKFADMGAFKQSISALAGDRHVILDARYVPIEEVRPLVELASVVVLPYRNATQSGVLHLAYTFGKPVIATRTGGLPEYIVPGRTGLLVEPGRPDQLADALRACIADPEAVRRMGEEARRLSQTEHAWSNVAAKILRVYEGLLADRPATERIFRTARGK